MGKLYAELDERLTQFISEQQVFFVATAPSLSSAGDHGHVNVSPKGYRDTFRVLGPRRVAYLDLTGSGAETIAHLKQNGKITIMFCSFSEQPKTLRLYGHGRVVLPDYAEWDELASAFGHIGSEDPAARRGTGRAGTRSIIVVDIDRIADSCGYSVPVVAELHERDLLEQWAGRKDRASLERYWKERNAESIDGLPALP